MISEIVIFSFCFLYFFLLFFTVCCLPFFLVSFILIWRCFAHSFSLCLFSYNEEKFFFIYFAACNCIVLTILHSNNAPYYYHLQFSAESACKSKQIHKIAIETMEMKIYSSVFKTEHTYDIKLLQFNPMETELYAKK